jgi:uncharacterized membrane protein HdeD (DUF308 family)
MLGVMDAASHWWAFALRGLAAVIYGILAFVWPGITLALVVLFWGAYALVDGVLTLPAGFRTAQDQRWLLFLERIVGIAAGIVTFLLPGLTALVLVYIIGAWALVTGVLAMIAAIRLRRVIENEWWFVLSGIGSVLFGITLLIAPGAGALALIWLMALYAIVSGILLIGLAFKLHGIQQQHHSPATA